MRQHFFEGGLVSLARRAAAAILAALALAAAAFATPPAQQVWPVPQARLAIDENGVELFSGRYFPVATVASIGQSGAGGMAEVYAPVSANARYPAYIVAHNEGQNTVFRVVMADRVLRFVTGPDNGEDFEVSDAEEGGNTLFRGVGTSYSLALSDGTTVEFTSDLLVQSDNILKWRRNSQIVALATDVTAPSGETFKYHYKTFVSATTPPPLNAT
jgi:hypothetical protein